MALLPANIVFATYIIQVGEPKYRSNSTLKISHFKTFARGSKEIKKLQEEKETATKEMIGKNEAVQKELTGKIETLQKEKEVAGKEFQEKILALQKETDASAIQEKYLAYQKSLQESMDKAIAKSEEEAKAAIEAMRKQLKSANMRFVVALVVFVIVLTVVLMLGR